MLTKRTLRAFALVLATAFVIGACASDEPETTEAPVAGAIAPADLAGDVSAWSPVSYDALMYALPTAVSGKPLVDSPPDVISADEADLANDLLIRRYLVDEGLSPSVISIAQRGTDYLNVPDVSITAVQFKGLPAEDFATFVPSVYLLATSVDQDQHRMTGAKPARYETEIEGRAVHASDWGAFDLVWYPHGDVVFIVLAKNPQLLASALRGLPPYVPSG